MRYAKAGGAAGEIIDKCFGRITDYKLWAWYCYHHNPDIILDKAFELASMERQGEIRCALTAFQKWLKKSFPEEPVCAKASPRQGGAK